MCNIRDESCALLQNIAGMMFLDLLYSTVVLHIAIMKVRHFLPQNIITPNQLYIYFVASREYWLAIAKLKNVLRLKINHKPFHQVNIQF